jgi:hypothetical protein
MGGIYAATTEGEEALAAATAETVLQLRGSTVTKARIVAWSVSFDGISATEAPVVVRLIRQTTDGTGSAATEEPLDPDSPTANCTAFHSFSAEPTAGTSVETYEIHPQGGLLIREYPPGREVILDNAATSRIAIECTAPAAVNAVAWMHWEE